MVVYISKKDETVKATMDPAYVREEGTVILDYITGPKAGKNVCISIATLKRWWRKSDEEVEVVEPEKEDKKVRVIDEIHLSNGQVLSVDVTDADKEIEKAAEKEKNKPVAKVPSGDVAKVKTLLEDNFILISHPSTPGEYAVKKEEAGKNVAVIRIGKKALTVYVNRTNIKFDYSISLENAVEQFCNYVETK